MLILLCKTQIKKKYLSTLLSTPLPSYLHHYAESPVSTPFPVITPTALSSPLPYLHRHRPAEPPLLYYYGQYVILTQRSPSSYEIASLNNPGEPLSVYHTSALTPCNNDKVKPLIPLRKCGCPPKVPRTPGSSSGRRRNQSGRM
ncbi:hypothetical protein TNCV_2166031 [Trichonephila clavipes]|nr:hypothetical protein TNCV_2166031 [Trichonephila clavipes]